MVVKDVDSVMTCGNILPTQYHATLGFPVNHNVPISKPKQAIFYIVCLRLIVDVCIYIYLTESDLCSTFPKPF